MAYETGSQHQQHNAKISLLQPANVDGIDMTQERVEKMRFFKHVFLICRWYRPDSAWAGTEFEDYLAVKRYPLSH